MDTVEKVAFYFGIEAYHLLIPNLSIADLIDVMIEGVINKYTQTSEHGRQEIIRTADNEFRYHAVSRLVSRAEQQQKELNQEQHAQDRQVMTRKKPSQFEIELAIEQERCVMERHEEAVIANERYVRLIKESCKQNECYCEPPCENTTPKITSYSNLIERAIPHAVTPADFANSWNFGFKRVFTCSLKTDFTLSMHSSIASLNWKNVS